MGGKKGISGIYWAIPSSEIYRQIFSEMLKKEEQKRKKKVIECFIEFLRTIILGEVRWPRKRVKERSLICLAGGCSFDDVDDNKCPTYIICENRGTFYLMTQLINGT